MDNDLLEHTLRFYSAYLSKITLNSNNNAKLTDKISFIYDFNGQQSK